MREGDIFMCGMAVIGKVNGNRMDKKELEKLQSVLIEILDFVCAICEEHNLTYFLVYGTALGAYRHQGFIPWDDDMDIAMPRNDYMKFLQIMKANNYELYEIQDEDNENNYFLSFAKVRKKNTLLLERYIGYRYSHPGIFIDVFPLDFENDTKSFMYQCRHKCITYLKHILKFQVYKKLYKRKESKICYLLDCVISYPASIISSKKILRKLNRLKMGKMVEGQSRYLAEYDSGSTQVMPYDIYFPPKKISFEGKQYCVPNQIEAYLSLVYGKDYMRLPPVEHRISNKVLEVKF